MAKGGGASRPRLRLLPTVLLTLAILALPTVVYAWGRSSSSFTIHRVAVTGTKVESHNRAQRLLRREFRGRNLFTVTAADVRRALAPLRYVDTVTVDRDFPDTLRVNVLEHRPRAFALAAGDWYVVADDGYVICRVGEKAAKGSGAAATAPAGSAASGSAAGREAAADGASGASASPAAAASPSAEAGQATGAASPDPSATAAGDSAAAGSNSSGKAGGDAAASVTDAPAAVLPTLEQGPAGSSLTLPRLAVTGRIRPGTVIEEGAVATALRILDGLPAKIRREVAVVTAAPGGQLTLRLSDGPTVVWGGGERSLAKTIALGVVLERYRRAGRAPTYIDVAVPDTVLAKPILK
jgi:cell division septal protein FtsQ